MYLSKESVSDIIIEILSCPQCNSKLVRIDSSLTCKECSILYNYNSNLQLDLRLKGKKHYNLEFIVGDSQSAPEAFEFSELKICQDPEVNWGKLKIPKHLTKELVSYIPKAKPGCNKLLDLGCGNAINKEICKHAGYEYIGIDYSAVDAPILGDAHAIPLADESVDVVLSIAVLEHIRFPNVMMREVYRVLKPGGTFIGTVSFLEPFHENSFHHFTHLGLFNLLKISNFNILSISPSSKWSVLIAQASMVLFPMLPNILCRMMVFPLQFIHKLWWKLAFYISKSKNARDEVRVLKTTAMFSYIVTKL